jgi:DmsE family decaheme c-type cytochrome
LYAGFAEIVAGGRLHRVTCGPGGDVRQPLRRISSQSWFICGVGIWVAALGIAAAAGAPGQESEWATAEKLAPMRSSSQSAASQPAAEEYVGDDTCAVCHDTQHQTYADTPHGRGADPRSPTGQRGCESCHGAGARHVEDPENVSPPVTFDASDPDAASTACTACHNRGEHALWDGSQHESRGVSCVSCHGVHTFKSETMQLQAANQTALCASCHRDKVSKLDRSGHMPVREGKMECTSCHNVHGATNVRLLRAGDSIAEACTSCHADKRGPYLWEHAPSRDGCVTCHDPHGSSNERMLVARPPILCQRCHVATRHPSTIYDEALVATSARVFARSCVTCHSSIHGSNHPSGQRFTR